MTRLLRWAGYGLAGIVALALLAGAAVFVQSERVLRRTYDAPMTTFAGAPAALSGARAAAGAGRGETGLRHLAPLDPTTGGYAEVVVDPAVLAEGERLARIRGCYGGCHGREMEGGVFFDQPRLARVVAPDLTRIVRTHSDAELDRVIRHGVRKNGRSTLAMPSSMFYHLSDADLAAIIAFLRSRPPTDGPGTEIHARSLGRLGLVLGQFPMQVPQIEQLGPRMDVPPGDTLALGRYLAVTVCSECHGLDLHGDPSGSPPDLRIAAAFPPDDFARLMRAGTGLGGRELGLMKEVALGRFAYLTDDEVAALHAYLSTLAAD